MSRSRAACGIRFRHLKRTKSTSSTKSISETRKKALYKLGFVDYASYLESELWKAIRQDVIERYPACEICGKETQCVHHIDYGLNCLAGKKPWKLVALCNGCHVDVEFLQDGTKRKFESVIRRTKKLLLRSNAWEQHTYRGRNLTEG